MNIEPEVELREISLDYKDETEKKRADILPFSF